MNPLMSRHKLAIKKGHIMRRLGQAIPEAPQPSPKCLLNRPGTSMDRAGWEAWKDLRTWTRPRIPKVNKIKNKRTQS